jgi:4-aminobutyrate aminotransferase-like enzyme
MIPTPTLHSLHADKVTDDPAIQAAINTILERLSEHQSDLKAGAPVPELAESYQARLDQFAQDRGGATFFPYLGSGFGRGALVELGDGRVVYDLITGIGAFPAGHGDPRIGRAQLNAALQDLVIQGNLQQNGDSAEFVRLLVDQAGKGNSGLKHCFLANTGVMAGENSLKIAFQKHAPAHRVLAFEGCFAGRTITFSHITDKPAFREGLPENLCVDYLPFFDPADPEGSTARALSQLQSHLKRHPGQYACMMFELVQGEGGFKVGQRAFFEALMHCCKAHEVAVLIDEVQTFARTPELFAFQYFGLEAYVDVVWIGKASQACATLYSEAYKPRPGLLSQTFTASTSAIAAGQVVVSDLLNGNYYGANGRLNQMHRRFVSCIESANTKLGNRLHGSFGVGGMWAFTLDEGAPARTKAFIQHLFEHGVMSFMAGSAPARVRFLPPILAITNEDMDAVFERIIAAVESFSD